MDIIFGEVIQIEERYELLLNSMQTLDKMINYIGALRYTKIWI